MTADTRIYIVQYNVQYFWSIHISYVRIFFELVRCISMLLFSGVGWGGEGGGVG
jgi:hypothetical protein